MRKREKTINLKKGKKVMNNIKQLTNYDDGVLDNMMGELKNNIHTLQGHTIGVLQAPTGVGKTHSSIRKIIPLMYHQTGVRFVLYVAPQKGLIGRSSLSNHIRSLKKKGHLVSELISTVKSNVTIGDIETQLMNRDDEEIIIVTMTDSFFNKNVDLIETLIIGNTLQMKTLVLLDEAHYGMVSHKDFYEYSLGSKNPEYNAVKFNNVVSILDVSYIIGLTATPIKEQIEESFGTDKYLPLNTYPSKDKLILRTAGYQEPIFYDWKNLGMENSLMKFFGIVSSKQTQLDTQSDNFNLPDECRVKLCGGIKIETPYKDKDKDDKYKLIEILNSDISIPDEWDWDLCLDTSDGISIWRFQDGEINELNKDDMRLSGYVDSDMLVNHLRNDTSRLKFMVVVNKGSMGLDIHNWNFGLSLRVPGTKDPDGVPVVLGGIQWCGRFVRITLPIESLSKYFDNIEDFKLYYSLVNSYQMMLPQSSYWRKTWEEVSNKINSIDDVNKFFDTVESK
tara:strand:- start:462 stop:1979 length:1518 start_codon:yes stop_codon:yes gene_type:complete